MHTYFYINWDQFYQKRPFLWLFILFEGNSNIALWPTSQYAVFTQIQATFYGDRLYVAMKLLLVWVTRPSANPLLGSNTYQCQNIFIFSFSLSFIFPYLLSFFLSLSSFCLLFFLSFLYFSPFYVRSFARQGLYTDSRVTHERAKFKIKFKNCDSFWKINKLK